MFTRIETTKQRLADQVYDQILKAIQAGAIQPAERIVQEKLAETLQISRTPVREALLRLEQEGLLVTSGRGGFLIRLTTDSEVREIYQTRAAIEGYAARLLASEGDLGKVGRIEAVIRFQESLQLTSAHGYYDANRAIHRSFVAETGNRYLLDMFDSMWNRGVSFHIFASMTADDLKSSLQGHIPLCEAIRSHDANRAAGAMLAHIENGLELQLAALAQARDRPQPRNSLPAD